MRPVLAGAIVAVVLSLLLTPPGRTAGKAALLVSEQLPHIPVKPLRWISPSLWSSGLNWEQGRGSSLISSFPPGAGRTRPSSSSWACAPLTRTGHFCSAWPTR